jgi:intein-encoded DNA endonuclease-like protein
LAKVRERKAAKTYEFTDYIEAIHELHQKGYSYAKIAEFLTARLGIALGRGQVYHVMEPSH